MPAGFLSQFFFRISHQVSFSDRTPGGGDGNACFDPVGGGGWGVLAHPFNIHFQRDYFWVGWDPKLNLREELVKRSMHLTLNKFSRWGVGYNFSFYFSPLRVLRSAFLSSGNFRSQLVNQGSICSLHCTVASRECFSTCRRRVLLSFLHLLRSHVPSIR